jgi:signal peptidase II
MSDAITDAGAAGAVRRAHVVLLGAVTLPLIILDQLTKAMVRARMEVGESIPIVPGWLDLTYTENPGAAFSLFANLPAEWRAGFLITLSIVAIVVLAVLLARSERVSLMSFALALVLAGAAGNLIDRARFGRVVDFVRVHYYDVWSYPVFNVADSAISIGVALIILAMLLERDARRD